MRPCTRESSHPRLLTGRVSFGVAENEADIFAELKRWWVLSVCQPAENGPKVHRWLHYLQIVLKKGKLENMNKKKKTQQGQCTSLHICHLVQMAVRFLFSYRVFLEVHRFSEGLRVFTLKDEIQQLLTAPPPCMGVVWMGSVSQLALHGLTTLRESKHVNISIHAVQMPDSRTAEHFLIKWKTVWFSAVRFCLYSCELLLWNVLPYGFAWMFRECSYLRRPPLHHPERKETSGTFKNLICILLKNSSMIQYFINSCFWDVPWVQQHP